MLEVKLNCNRAVSTIAEIKLAVPTVNWKAEDFNQEWRMFKNISTATAWVLGDQIGEGERGTSPTLCWGAWPRNPRELCHCAN